MRRRRARLSTRGGRARGRMGPTACAPAGSNCELFLMCVSVLLNVTHRLDGGQLALEGELELTVEVQRHVLGGVPAMNGFAPGSVSVVNESAFVHPCLLGARSRIGWSALTIFGSAYFILRLSSR